MVVLTGLEVQTPPRQPRGKWLCRMRTFSGLWKHFTYCPGFV